MSKQLLTSLLSATLLFACGGNDSNDRKPHDHHQHDDEETSIIVSTDDTHALLHLEGHSFSAFTHLQATSASFRVAQDQALFASFIGSEVAFFHLHNNEPEPLLSIINAHDLSQDKTGFSVLANGVSEYYQYDNLSNERIDPVPIHGENQTVAAVTIDSLYRLTFNDNKGRVLSFDTKDKTEVASFTCVSPTSIIQRHGLTLVTCGNETHFVLQENKGIYTGVITFEGKPLTASWSLTQDIFLGFKNNQLFKLQIEDNNGSFDVHAKLITIESQPQPLDPFCAITSNTDNAVIFLLTDKAEIAVLTVHSNIEGENPLQGYRDITRLEYKKSLALDETYTNFNCQTVLIRSHGHSLVVADNNAHKMYLVDSHGGPYHIHKRIDLKAAGITGNIADMAVFSTVHHPH